VINSELLNNFKKSDIKVKLITMSFLRRQESSGSERSTDTGYLPSQV